MKRRAFLALSFLALAPAAQAAPPNPFGHACAPQSGVLFCPTASDAERVPSFDGVPLDVDVTLPPTGDGPFPALVMMHGWGGDKASFEAPTPDGNGGTTFHYNNVFYAQQGYAVINASARGFGRSCGLADSRTPPACDRGWLHLTDHRYESRDTQHLLGLLVDEGVLRRREIGVTGISYGGIQTQSLARLRNRIRLRNGDFRRWRSPRGRPLRVAAAWSRWGGSDLTYSLMPNGRFLDFRGFSPEQSRSPVGVWKQSFNNGLYFLGITRGQIAPEGRDPGADVTGWKAIGDRGEPIRAEMLAIARELTSFHSAAGLEGPTAPLLLQSGWTDDLFPVEESLRVYRTYRRSEDARVSLQLGDLGHGRGANKPDVERYFNDRGAAFFAAYLKGRGKPPRHNSVTAFTQTCPKTAAAAGPYRAASWERLHPRRIRMAAPRLQRIASDGGDADTARAFDLVTGNDPCGTVPTERAPGTAVVERRVGRPFTLLGLPTVRARIRTSGRGGLIAARLFDVHLGTQTLVARGVFGNGWRFARGHSVKLELLGSDPSFVRTSNNRFSVRLRDLELKLPTR
jgi:fermentation-respiration switch protein FrsA (DUF1100 family)